jgi:hypothetical protein
VVHRITSFKICIHYRERERDSFQIKGLERKMGVQKKFSNYKPKLKEAQLYQTKNQAQYNPVRFEEPL